MINWTLTVIKIVKLTETESEIIHNAVRQKLHPLNGRMTEAEGGQLGRHSSNQLQMSKQKTNIV